MAVRLIRGYSLQFLIHAVVRIKYLLFWLEIIFQLFITEDSWCSFSASVSSAAVLYLSIRAPASNGDDRVED